MAHGLDPAPTVLVVGGDARVRRALAGLLEAHGRVFVAGAADSPADLPGRAPDLVLVDLEAGDAPLSVSIAAARAAWPQATLLVVAAAWLDGAQAVAAGADGFVSTLDSPQSVLATVDEMLRRDRPAG